MTVGAIPIPRPPEHPAENWFRILAETTATAIVLYDGESFLYANRAAEEITGYTREELTALGPLGITHPSQREAIGTRLAARLRGELPPERFEVRLVHKDGRDLWLELTSCPIFHEGRRTVLASGQDITERKLAGLALSAEKEHAQVTLASIGDGVIRTDAGGRIDYMNPVAEQLTGWPAAEAAGKPLGSVYRVHDETTDKPLADPLAVCLGQRRPVQRSGGRLLVRGDHIEYAVEDSAAPILDRDGRPTGAVLVIKDVTRLRGMERQVTYLTTHDPLTGLLNRPELERRLEAALVTARAGDAEHALCYLDLDEFKLINDTCGHVAGDEMLRQLAVRLDEAKPEGAALARLGGDEFAVLLHGTSRDGARGAAERLRDAVARFRFVWSGEIFDPKVSIGLTRLDGDSETIAQVLSAADAACYVAKERGRDRVHEYQPDDTALARRHGEMRWIHHIHKAFDEDRFRLYRQSIQPLADGAEGASRDRRPLAEIFIRMLDPDGSLVTPGSFIPAAERYHLIPAIDRWVARTAFRTLAAGGGDPRTSYAVNLSGQSLGDESFLDDVVAELEASGLDPRRILFEITETAAIAHLAQANRFINVLRAMGCRFILDDFGNGLSSFAYLRNLEVDYLKISSQFVRGVDTSDVQRTLVASIHQIGERMQMGTIAEGVETAEQLEALRSIGVHYAQGYWIERPRPLE